ncbi:MAG: rare lipoprotein [Thermoleophilia bacterium]|nr:rare lipoprotein [Thermoleophilia bacterium]
MLSLDVAPADVLRVRPLRHPIAPARVARIRRCAAACLAIVALAATPAFALAADASTTDLAPIASVPDAPSADPFGGATTSGGGSLVPESEGDLAIDAPATDADGEVAVPDGSLAQLRQSRAALDAQRSKLQDRLLQLEAARELVEQRLDRATTAVASRLVELFEADEQERLSALMAVRDATDPATRSDLLDSLVRADYLLVSEQDAASDAATIAAGRAGAVRSDVLALGTRIAALDAAIAERAPQSADDRQRAAGTRYSVDADLVFATGPIPGIGYWGAVADGGSMLSGWSGYAGAALGGVGCTSPDPALTASGSIEQGEASWYGPGFDGQATANGETYDQEALTAAHKTLPFNTIVRVTSSTTGRCVFVRITDRGPFVDGRIIDLSHAAATEIGMSGTAPVQLEVWSAPAPS